MLVDNPGKSNQQMLPSELVQSARLLYRQNPADVLVKESVSYQQLSILQRATGATQISSWRFHQCWISRVPHIYSTKKSHMTKRHVTRQVIKGDSALTSCILSQQLLHVYFHLFQALLSTIQHYTFRSTIYLFYSNLTLGYKNCYIH